MEKPETWEYERAKRDLKYVESYLEKIKCEQASLIGRIYDNSDIEDVNKSSLIEKLYDENYREKDCKELINYLKSIIFIYEAYEGKFPDNPEDAIIYCDIRKTFCYNYD